jgi:predicted dehydrogenase
MRDFKWGVLAPGSIARRFANGLAAAPNAVKYAVGSRDIGRARAFADEYGFAKAYGSYKELAGDPDVDVIYVATPHPQHEEAVLTCLDAGKAVLCEKPFAPNARQASRMIARAREKGVFLMEGMWTRFLPGIAKVRELIAGGEIGKVRHVAADFGFRANVDPDGRLFAPGSAGGSLLDVGVYNASFCSMIFGGRQPDRIQSHMQVGSTGVDEITSLLFNYSGGLSAQLLSAIRLNTPQDATIFGEDGYIKLPGYWHGDTVILNNKAGTKEFNFPFEASGFQFEAAEVMSRLDGGHLESAVMPLDETLAVIETLDKIRFDNHLVYPFECGEDIK